MIFIKNFNNNAALVRDQTGVEWVVVGSGVGFGKKAGDTVDEDRINRRFVAVEKNLKMVDSVSDMDRRTLSLTTKVINLVTDQLQIKFSDYQFIVLASHIDLILKGLDGQIQYREGVVCWGLSKLFPHEFAVAKQVTKLISENSKFPVPIGEVSYLTYRFVDANSERVRLGQTFKNTKFINEFSR